MLGVQRYGAEQMGWTSIVESGEYGNPVSYRIWFLQLLAWLSIILVSKWIVTVALLSTARILGQVGNWLFSPLNNHPFAELMIVMVLCPCFLNILQFWIQDSYLKRNRSKQSNNFDKTLQMSLLGSSV